MRNPNGSSRVVCAVDKMQCALFSLYYAHKNISYSRMNFFHRIPGMVCVCVCVCASGAIENDDEEGRKKKIEYESARLDFI